LSEVRGLKREIAVNGGGFSKFGTLNPSNIGSDGPEQAEAKGESGTELLLGGQSMTQVVKFAKQQHGMLHEIHEALINHSLDAQRTLAYVEKRIDFKVEAMERLESRIVDAFNSLGSTVVVDTPELRSGLLKMVEGLLDEVSKKVDEDRKTLLGKFRSDDGVDVRVCTENTLLQLKRDKDLLELPKLVAAVERCVNLLSSKYAVTPGPVETIFKSLMTSAFSASGVLTLLGGATKTVETGGFIFAGMRLFGTTATVLNPGAIGAAGVVGLMVAAANIYGMLHGVRVPELFKRFARAKQEKGYVNPFATLRMGTPSFLGTGASVGLSLRDPKTFEKEMFYAWDGNVLSIARFADDLLRIWLDKDLDLRDLRAKRERAQNVVDNSVRAENYTFVEADKRQGEEREAEEEIRPDGTKVRKIRERRFGAIFTEPPTF